MDLLAEVKVRGHRMLEEVNQEVAAEHQPGRERGEARALGEHLQEDRRQHEARAERDGVAQEAVVPAPERDHRTPEQVGGRRQRDADEAEGELAVTHASGPPPKPPVFPQASCGLATTFGGRFVGACGRRSGV